MRVLRNAAGKPGPAHHLVKLTVSAILLVLIFRSVDLAASHSSTRAFKGVINAVLRGLLREPPNLDEPEALAPPWLYA